MSEKDHDLLIRIDENVRYFTKVATERFTEHTSKISDHESRIRVLENTREQGVGSLAVWARIMAALAAVGGVIGAIYWLR